MLRLIHRDEGAVGDVVGELESAALGEGLTSVFQPIVSLPDETVVGYEALARWSGMPAISPLAVFDHASQNGTLERLDRLCIESAIDGVEKNVIGLDALLCINCEALTTPDGRAAEDVRDRENDLVQVMFEFTERGLLTHPRALLRHVLSLRERGFRIALDDVGAHPDSLALLDVICPDAIKLDLHLVQAQPQDSQARTLAAVMAHQERTDAVIVAEGIETADHLEQALALGANLGQGHRFGRPGPVSGKACTPCALPGSRFVAGDAADSPFDLVAAGAPVRTVRKATLLAFARQIESHVLQGVETPLVFVALQDRSYVHGKTWRQYQAFAEKCPMVAVFGRDLPEDLGGGLRSISLSPEDPLCREWTVVALGAHTAVALIARQRDWGEDDHLPESDRRFDFVITYDRTLVTKAARNLMDRMP